MIPVDKTPEALATTRDSMHILGAKSANDFLESVKCCVNPSAVFEVWRARCYVEMAEKCKGHVDLANLVTAWERGFDSVHPLGLTQNEVDLLNAYRMTDSRGRESILGQAQSQAEDWPRYTFYAPVPAAGGAS